MREAFSPAFVGIVLGVAATRGGPAQAEAERARIDPKADALLRKMSAGLAHTKRFQFDAEHVQEVVTKDGQKLQFVAQSRVSVQRPNMVRSERLGPIANATFYYDGDRITIHGKRTGLYATTEAPPTLDAAIDFSRDELGLEAPAADLLYADVYGGLMEGVESGTYVGLEPIGDRMCHHLAYRGDETDWQIWIEDGPRALPCRYVITSKKLKGSPEFAVAFKNWDVAPNLTASQFQFTPPPGATEIEFLRESRQGADRRNP